ncbi:MAG TPA: tetratricopeptide repeat protein [Mariprofundaceae bacterium]|nr:tetratricopeptide repeat protein [Mariprofundaceae bacterium]
MCADFKLRTRYVYIAVFLAAAMAYANAFAGVFQFDDYNVIVHNDAVHSWAVWWNDFGHGIRPLLKLSYLLNWLSGFGEIGFHVVNLCIHAVTAMLVYQLSRLFLQQAGKQGDSHDAIALAAALLFAVHPVHTEAVTYISGRSSSLMALLYLSALLAHAGLHRQGKARLAQPITLLLFLLAVAVKESAATLPLALLLWDKSTGVGWREAMRRQWGIWLAWCGLCIWFLAQPGYASMLLTSASMHAQGFWGREQLAGMAYLIGQYLWPLSLNIDPDFGHSDTLTFLLVGLGALLPVAWFLRRELPVLAFSLLWLFVHLVVLHLFFPRLDIANERQLYLADWPLCLLLATGLWHLPQRRVAVAAITVLLVLLAGMTLSRNTVYRSEVALWEDTVLKSPHKARVHNNLGVAYLLAGRTDEAKAEFATALSIEPGYEKARDNLLRMNGDRVGQQE